MEKFGILLYNSCGVKKENECCREISQQHQVQVLREAEIGRGLFRGPPFRWTRGLPSGRVPGKEQKLPPS